MRLPNGYGGVVKLSGKRRKPFAARVTAGWKLNERTGKAVQQYQILGYSETKAGTLQILAKYNDNPIDLSAMKLTFEDIYTRWSEEKYPTISSSNVNGYKASFALCSGIANKHFLYRNYYDSYFKPLMKNLDIERTPHCCRHTCISMLTDAHVDQTTIKKIVGYAGAMTLTEKVYTHMDIGELVKAINLI